MLFLLNKWDSPNSCSSINRNYIYYIYLKMAQDLDTDPIESVLWIAKRIRR